MSIRTNLSQLLERIPGHVRLVAVSKTKSAGEILEAYEAGQRIFGENKVQELINKQPDLPHDIQWHYVGHLQTNKVKFLAPFIDLIHAVDSLKLLREIDKQARKNNRVIDCLLQFHIAREETKYGLSLEEARELLTSELYSALTHVRIVGVMGMATFTEDDALVRSEFQTLRHYFETIKSTYFSDAPYFREISMGMSGDFQTAIEEGSTLVRIGTLLFGERDK